MPLVLLLLFVYKQVSDKEVTLYVSDVAQKTEYCFDDEWKIVKTQFNAKFEVGKSKSSAQSTENTLQQPQCQFES